MNINVSSPANHSARNICSDTDIHKLQYNVKMQICTGATGGGNFSSLLRVITYKFIRHRGITRLNYVLRIAVSGHLWRPSSGRAN